MRYLNEEQEQRLNELLRKYTDEREQITVRSGRTIAYRGTPGETPEIDRITPQQLENLSKAVNNPEQSTGKITISKEQSYQVQAGKAAEDNTLQPVVRSQKSSSPLPEMASMQTQIGELFEQNSNQSDRLAAWEKEMTQMRSVIARQERLLQQATTPVHHRLDNWFDNQKNRMGNWLNQQKEQVGNRIENFNGNAQERVADAMQQVRQVQELRAQDIADRATERTELRQEVQRLQEEIKRLQKAQRRAAIEAQQRQKQEHPSKLEDARQRQLELSEKDRAVTQPVNQNREPDYSAQKDPWTFRYTRRAPDEEQIKMGIIPPRDITQAGAETHAMYVSELRKLKAESIAEAQENRLKKAGITVEPKKSEAIRKEAFDKVESEWQQSNAEALKLWQESKGQKENHQPQTEEKASVRVHISELKQWRQEAQAIGHSEKYLNKIDQINELARQKASPDGIVMLKEQDWKKMQLDRPKLRQEAKSEVQSQSWGMRR